MYEVRHRFEDLEAGMSVLWNGDERRVEHVGDDHAVIANVPLSKHRINGMFKSHDEPFEVIR